MRKKLMMLGLVSLLGATAYAVDETPAPKADSAWNLSAKTYIENEQYTGTNIFKNGGSEGENGFFIGQGFTANKGDWTYSLNAEQRLLGHQNDEGYSKSVSRIDYKLRYQLTDKVGVAAKYRSDNATTGKDRDRYELGIDTSYQYLSGWFVVGHDIDSNQGGANRKNTNGNYYEGDMGPMFKLTDTLTLKPSFYATGEFYGGGIQDAYNMNAGQARLTAFYNATPKLTLIPYVRYTIYKEIKAKSNKGTSAWNNYKAAGRVRVALEAAYTINDTWSVNGGVAYDTQTRKFAKKTLTKDSKLNMMWYTLGVNYKF